MAAEIVFPEEGWTAAHWACAHDDIDRLVELLDDVVAGDPNAETRGRQGMMPWQQVAPLTLLDVCAREGALRCARLLVERGAEVTLSDVFPSTLEYAVASGSVDMIAVVVNASVGVVGPGTGLGGGGDHGHDDTDSEGSSFDAEKSGRLEVEHLIDFVRSSGVTDAEVAAFAGLYPNPEALVRALLRARVFVEVVRNADHVLAVVARAGGVDLQAVLES